MTLSEKAITQGKQSDITVISIEDQLADPASIGSLRGPEADHAMEFRTLSRKLDPDPHQSEKQDSDPHQSEKVEDGGRGWGTR